MQRIVICGIPRSGSTLVGQIFKEVFHDREITKTHPDIWEPDGSPMVATIRNPYDVVASLYRVRLSRSGFSSGGPVGLEAVLHRVEICFEAMLKVWKEAQLTLRYERFFDNYSIIYCAILDVFRRLVLSTERDRISTKFSLHANTKRAAKLRSFNEVDEDGIHGDHIGPVMPGSWKNALPEWAYLRVTEVCAPIAERWGYAS